MNSARSVVSEEAPTRPGSERLARDTRFVQDDRYGLNITFDKDPIGYQRRDQRQHLHRDTPPSDGRRDGVESARNQPAKPAVEPRSQRHVGERLPAESRCGRSRRPRRTASTRAWRMASDVVDPSAVSSARPRSERSSVRKFSTAIRTTWYVSTSASASATTSTRTARRCSTATPGAGASAQITADAQATPQCLIGTSGLDHTARPPAPFVEGCHPTMERTHAVAVGAPGV